MDNYLQHHGILGQRWGVRRFQNYDGTLTAEGKAKYGKNIKDVSLDDLADQITTYVQRNRNSESSKYSNKIMTEAKNYANSTKSGKELNDYKQKIIDEYNKTGYAKLDQDRYQKLYEKYINEVYDYADGKNYFETYSKMVMTELGYEYSESGRKYISKAMERVHEE